MTDAEKAAADSQPTPVSALDVGLSQHLARTRRMQQITLGLVLLVLAGLFADVLSTNSRVDSQISAFTSGQCGFYLPVTSIPVFVTPQDGQPATTRLGTQLVVGARNSYIRLHCHGQLEPASLPLRELAMKYHIQLDG